MFDDALRRLAHLLAPAVVRTRHRGLQLGVDALEPHVVLGAVDHHGVDALVRDGVGDTVTGEALGDDLLAVLGDHVVGGPVDGLLELAEDRRQVLGVATVDRDGVVVVEAGDRLAVDPVDELLVEKPRPEVGRVHHVGVSVENLEPVAHRYPLRFPDTWRFPDLALP